MKTNVILRHLKDTAQFNQVVIQKNVISFNPNEPNSYNVNKKQKKQQITSKLASVFHREHAQGDPEPGRVTLSYLKGP